MILVSALLSMGVIFVHVQCPHHVFQTVACENTHQIIFYRQEETVFALVTLTTGTTTELVVDTAGFVTLCTQNVQTAGCLNILCLFLYLIAELLVQFWYTALASKTSWLSVSA